MLHNYITMNSANNLRIKVSTTQNLILYELKQHKPWFHEEYSQILVQRKQGKVQLFTESQPKRRRESKQCKALSLKTVQEKNI